MGTRLERFQETFGLDLRSLSILRMLIGCMLLIDNAVRIFDLRSHYTDAGVVPSAFAQSRNLANYPGRFSFHLDGDVTTQAILFGLSFAFAIALLLGYRTKISLAASLLLMISVQNRNMEIETGGDYLLRLVCLWCLLLPLSARFSLDARAGRAQVDPANQNYRGNQYFSVATLGLLIQMAIVYYFSALHKNHVIWRMHHTAIHYALHIDAYDTTLGEFLRQYPALTAAFTRGTLSFETVAPFLIFSAGLLGLLPVLDKLFYPLQSSLRTLVSIAFVFFHLGLAMTLSLGTFAWFAALIWIGLFPTWAWDRLADFRAGVAPPDPYALAEDENKKPEDSDEKSEGKKSNAKKTNAKKSKKDDKPKLPLLYRLRSPWLLRALTKVEIAALKFETPPKKKKAKLPPRGLLVARAWVYDLSAGVLLFYTVLWNLQTLEPKTYSGWIRGTNDIGLPDARPLLNFFRVDQHWGLFAPYPRTSDGYYVVVLKKKNGEEIDYLRDDQKVTWEKPDDVSGSYSTFRWRKYFRNIRRRSKRQNLSLYSNYLCRQWDAAHDGDDELSRVTIYFMRRTTLKKGGHSEPKKEKLWSQGCQSANVPYGQPVRSRRPRSLPPTVNSKAPLNSGPR